MQQILSVLTVLGVGSIVAALISWRVAIANHRQEWINGLRDDLAMFLKELTIIYPAVNEQLSLIIEGDSVNAAKSAEIERRIQAARAEILLLYWRVVFRLNPTETIHSELRRSLDTLMTEVSGHAPDQGKVAALVEVARRILKHEWNVTKYGIFTTPILRFKRWWSANVRSS